MPAPLLGNFERSESWSFECWFYQTSIKSAALISNTNADMRGWLVTLYTGRNIGMALSNTNGSNFLAVRTASAQYTYNTWNHVVFTYNGTSTPSGIKCYINGAAKTLSTLGDTLTASIKSDSQLWLGHSNVYPYLNGRLDEVVLYDRVLTQTEVSQRYNSGAGTSALFGSAYLHYPLNDSDILVTETQRKKHGEVINSATWGNGKVGNGIQLNGSNQYIELGNKNYAIPPTVSDPQTVHALNNTIAVEEDAVVESGGELTLNVSKVSDLIGEGKSITIKSGGKIKLTGGRTITVLADTQYRLLT